MKKYILKNVLHDMKPTDIVAIGTKGGSGFAYIGEAGNTKLIDNCFYGYVIKAKRTIRSYENKLEELILTPPVMTDDDNKNRDLIRSRASSIVGVVNTINKNRDYIVNYTSPLERDVLETYHKDVDNCLGIIIDGPEQGGFWTKEEFDKKTR